MKFVPSGALKAVFVLFLVSSGRMTSAQAVTGYQLVNAFGANTFTQPVCIRSAPGETNRIFILEKTGAIRLVTNLSATNPTKSAYMNLASGLSASGEQGLLGLAFHPNFQSSGYFFIYRSVVVGGLTYERLARFQADPPSAATASASTEVVLFDQRDPADNHNGGDLHFGNDGYLYVSLGDGGMQNDFYSNSQTIRKGFHSGLLRIDVDQRVDNIAPNPPSSISELTISTNYLVPNDNPFFTDTLSTERNTSIPTNSIRTEYWAVGLRNPWRFSIDPVTGWIWVGDVGGSLREEVDVIARGGNYGWVYREGTGAGPVAGPTGFTGLPPIYQYNHGNTATNTGNSITGGLVYRGGILGQLTGAYVFCDYTSGNIWALRYDGNTVTEFHNLMQNGLALKQTGIVAFGTDPRNGDILMAGFGHNLILRLTVSVPALTITRELTPGQITLSWPFDVGAFDPYSTTDLGSPNSWLRVATSATVSNGRWVVTLPAADQTEFFRLQSQ